MKKILVPCDFSKPAVNALRFAIDVASKSNGVIHVINVIELPVFHDTVLMPVLNFEEELFKELHANAKKSLDALVDKYPHDDVRISKQIVLGSVFSTILNYVKEEDIDLIIMGSHGASGMRELLLGSNAEKMVRNSTVPVIVTKEYHKGPVSNIIFPNNLIENNQEELTMKIKALQAFFKAHLNIVWINTPLNFQPDALTLKRLEAFVKRYMIKDYTISIYNSTDEESGILQFADLVKADMIALGTHGRKGLAHVLNGSLAEDLVNHTKDLVWTYSLKNDMVKS